MATTNKKPSQTLGNVGSVKKPATSGGNGKDAAKTTGCTTCAAEAAKEAAAKEAAKKVTKPAQVPTGMHGQPATGNGPTPQQIAERAYLIWELQGRQHGKDLENWLEAERQLRQESQQRRRH